MVDLARYTEVRRLIDALAPAEDRLTPNECELYRTLRARHADPGEVPFDDVICLEVMLRNVEIRKGYGTGPAEMPGRVIELTPTGRARKR